MSDVHVRNTKELIAATIIAILLAFMELSGLPSAWFVHIQILDIEPFYFTLMVNFIIMGILCFILTRIFCPKWPLGLRWNGVWTGLKKYGAAGILALLFSFAAFYIGLYPFDSMPSVWKLLVEGVIYYLGVGIIEELYVRGFFLNIIEKFLHNSKKSVMWAVIISSVIFGFGHMFGSLGSSPLTIICKVIWTIGLGIYYGAVYKKTGNLWVPIILHTVMDFCGIPFCFTMSSVYPTVSLCIILPVYVLLGAYGIYILKSPEKQK